MPGLVRKVLLIAAVEGLFLLPSGPNANKSTGRSWWGAKITYKTGVVSPCTSSDKEAKPDIPTGTSIETLGIAGLLKLSSGSWLIAITKRESVAEIKGRQVYAITDIALIPLASKSEAETAINAIKQGGASTTPRGSKSKTPVEDSETDEEDNVSAISEGDVSDVEEPDRPTPKRRSSIVEDVIGRKGAYGPFAERWFSRRGWQVDRQRLQGLSNYEDENERQQQEQSTDVSIGNDADQSASGKGAVSDAPADAEGQVKEEIVKGVATTLTPKLLRTTKILLAASRSFFFSYEYDLTRSLATQPPYAGSSLPLYKQVDKEFWWNRHLISPFTDGKNDQFALPLVQGFVGQANFQVPTNDGSMKNLMLTLISRRSVKRAGLRYLRRGCDHEGNVANFVETEQLITDVDTFSNYSLVQIRGSIPAFFKQSPYALKPRPSLYQTEEANKQAFQLHCNKLHERYGRIQAVSLVEKGAQEAVVGNLFEKRAKEMEEPKIDFEWFDFHHECRGMRFENVSKLLVNIGSAIEKLGWTEEAPDGILRQKQQGVVRTNCMDCLDRTNVVQSAIGRAVLDQQLASMGVDTSDLDEHLNFMNMIWADNGDAVSKQYSSTAALKGDFTRTKKRNISGALSDFGLTLTRFYNNVIGDYFTQAAIDYLLGNANEQIFVEFESKMMSGDPSVSLKKLRENAIETSAKIVIEDESEEILGAWALSVPQEENSLRTPPFKDAVLLLTDAAVYFCRFDFQMDKVSSFTRIDLLNIKKIQYGTYITSTLTSSSTDPKLNYGFIIRYNPGRETSQRINTRTLTSTKSLSSRPSTAATNPQSSSSAPKDGGNNNDNNNYTGVKSSDSSLQRLGIAEPFLAFKALPVDSAMGSDPDDKERNLDVSSLVKGICKDIESACLRGEHRTASTTSGGGRANDNQSGGGGSGLLEEKEIISLAEAKKSTGFLEQVGYSIRRMVWG